MLRTKVGPNPTLSIFTPFPGDVHSTIILQSVCQVSPSILKIFISGMVNLSVRAHACVTQTCTRQCACAHVSDMDRIKTFSF